MVRRNDSSSLFLVLLLVATDAWTNLLPIRSRHVFSQVSSFGVSIPSSTRTTTPFIRPDSWLAATPSLTSFGNIHGQGACFLPLKQLGSDYYAPRIVQIAGAYPGLSRNEFLAVQSEPPADQGQWTYDFSDPDGPQLGTVALEGSNLIASCQDPVVVIAEHTSLGVELPKEVVDPVDLVVLVDRSKKVFGERKFLVVHTPDNNGNGISIAAFASKHELPANAEILGQVELVQIPWLPCMQPSKTGFMEEDEYF